MDWAIWALKDVKNNPKVDLFAAFGKDVDPLPGTRVKVGEAFIEGACNKWTLKEYGPIWAGTSFNEWARTPSATAMVYILIDFKEIFNTSNIIYSIKYQFISPELMFLLFLGIYDTFIDD